MRVRISNPAMLGDLQAYLRATQCAVEQLSPTEIEVSVPRAPSVEQAEREIALYVKTWKAMNPGIHVSVD